MALRAPKGLITREAIDLDAEADTEDGPATAVDNPPPLPPPVIPAVSADDEGWRITWRGVTVTDRTALAAHLAVVTAIDSRPWPVSPWTDAVQLLAWVAAVHAVAAQLDPPAALAAVVAAPLSEVLGALATREG